MSESSASPITSKSIMLIADYLRAIGEVAGQASLFRGHSQACSPEPSAFRPGVEGIRELNLLRDFKNALRMHSSFSIHHEIEWLAVAQHYGIPTSLLDWTESPLVALYFACVEDDGYDGEVIFTERGTLADIDFDRSCEQIFSSSEVSILRGKNLFHRAAMQRGVMTFHPPALFYAGKSWHRDSLYRVQPIPAEQKAGLRRGLAIVGFDQHSLFPDFDGAVAAFKARLAASKRS